MMTVGGFVSCESGVVLGIPRNEVLENLKNQRIDFILDADLDKMDEFKKLGSDAPFYIGLLLKEADDIPRAERLFAAALESSSAQIRRASSVQLLPLLTSQHDSSSVYNSSSVLKHIEKITKSRDVKNDISMQTLQNAIYYLSRNYREIETLPADEDFSSWNEGFSLLANCYTEENPPEEQKQNIRDYFLAGTIDEARIWAFRELESLAPVWFSSAEMNAVKGRIAVSKSNFTEGISLLQSVIAEKQALFFEYIDLLHDLGRAYQFTQHQQEGIERFSEWETWLRTGADMGTSLLTVNITENRYRLLYFIGRIEQQRQNYAESIEVFSEAVKLTADKAQQDACIWYVLNAVLLENPGEIIAYLKEYTLPWNPINWNDDVYFADIMDRVSQYLTFSGDWQGLLEVFALIESGNDHATTAKYAYIIARSLMEGLLPANNTEETAEYFFRIAFEAGGQSFYYKALSASYLDEEIELFPDEAGASALAERKYRTQRNSAQRTTSNTEELEFLLGFFEYGAESFVYSYFRDLPLCIDEQRIIAERFIQAENWYDAIRVSSVFMNREDYELTRADMELFYPAPYTEVVEKNAVEQNIPVEILFGLIRTESAFDKDIRSWAGAIGLSQLITETALDMAGRIVRAGGPNYIENGEIDLQNPETNVHIGAFYLNYLIDYTKSPALALVAYNGGMGRVRRWRAAKPNLPEDLFLETIPYAETRDYGRKVLGAAAAYGYLYYKLSMDAVIADIFR